MNDPQPGIVRSTFVFEWNRVDLDADDKEFSSSCWGIINGEWGGIHK